MSGEDEGGLSRAHRLSSPYVIDPDYRTADATADGPEMDDRLRWWLYGESECESYRLATLRRHVREARLNVYCPGEYALPSRRAYFLAEITSSDLLGLEEEEGTESTLTNSNRIRMMSNGRGTVRLVRRPRKRPRPQRRSSSSSTGSRGDCCDGVMVVHEYGSRGNVVGEMEEFDIDIRNSSSSAAADDDIVGEGTGGEGIGGGGPSYILIEFETGCGGGKDDDIPEPPCLWIDIVPSAGSSSFSSSRNDRTRRITERAWMWSADGMNWMRTTAAAEEESSSSSTTSSPYYPHRIESSPEIRLGPREVLNDVRSETGEHRGILYDFGLELFGTVMVEVDADVDGYDDSSNPAPISLYVGESRSEVMNDDPNTFEQSTELIRLPPPSEDNDDEGDDGGAAAARARRYRYRSRFPLAFRYVRLLTTTSATVHRPPPPDVSVMAQFHPVQYRGAFHSQNRPLLNKIWTSSAYTLRLCCTPHGGAFILDGIKRDRLPWVGDLAVSLLVNRVTFVDVDVIRHTLTVLGTAGIGREHINGIVDYTLWWVICHDLYQLHYGTDLDYLEKEWTRIRSVLTALMDSSDDETGGFLQLNLKPSPPGDDVNDGEDGGGGGEEERYDWIFVDWSITDDRRKVTSIQILFWWALRSGASLASRYRRRRPVETEDAGGDADEDLDAFVDRLERRRDVVRDRLLDVCHDDGTGLWLASPPPTPLSSSSSSGSHAHTAGTCPDGRCYSRHASILAVVSGLLMDSTASITPESRESLRDELLGKGFGGLEDDDVVGTPYFKYWECVALFRLGATREALNVIERYWGGMLRSGATTFWESYEPSKEGEEDQCKHAEMYGRSYGRSLCHAWGAGPCHLLSSELFGLRPLEDGYREWTIRYPLPSTDGTIVDAVLSVAVPSSPSGGSTIEIGFRGDDDDNDDDALPSLKIKVPHDTSLVLSDGRRHVGPTAVSLPLPGTIGGGGGDGGDGTISDDDVKRYSAEFRGWHHHPDFVIPPNPKIDGFDDDVITMTDVPTIYRLPPENDEGDNAHNYYMAFVGYDGSGYQSFVARSHDLIHWDDIRLAMRRSDVVGDFDHGGVVLGGFLYEDYELRGRRTLKKVDGRFWALYGCYAERGGYEIDPGYEGLAWSVDGLYWERAMDCPILSVNDSDVGSWENASIYQPWLMEHHSRGKKYYNFYNAKTLDPQWTEQIGLATSRDMKNWTRQEGNPVLKVRPGGYDSRFCADPKVWRDDDDGGEEGDDDGKFVMLYFGVDDSWHAHIMIAYSRHLHHGGCWKADPEPLYLAGGNPSGIDEEHAHKASLIWNETDGTWYLFYCAVGKDGRGIGLIASTPKV